jgi:hypothetical protein
VPNVTERPISGGNPIAAQPVAAETPVARVEVKAPAAPADGVEAPRPAAPDAAPADAAPSPRKTIGQRLGAVAKMVVKGAAIAGLAASLIVGGNFVLSRMNGNIPEKPPTPIEAPVEIHTPVLPGQGPPSSDVVTPGGQGAGGGQVHAPTLPGAGTTLPSGQGTPAGVSIDSTRLGQQPTFTPHSIRVPPR